MKRTTAADLAAHLVTATATLDALRGEARELASQVRALRTRAVKVTTALARKGFALAERAYDDDGGLLDPATEAAVNALDDGLPDFGDDLDLALEGMRALDARLADTLAERAAIVVPTAAAAPAEPAEHAGQCPAAMPPPPPAARTRAARATHRAIDDQPERYRG